MSAGEAEGARPADTRRALGEMAYGLGLAAVGVAIAIMTTGLKVAPLYSKVGPTIFPWAIAGAMVVVGLALAIRGWLLRPRTTVPRDLPALLLLATGLAQQILLVRWAGFVPTAALLFLATATAFGRRRPLVDLIIGLVLALAVYLIFTRLLGLSLPAGWLQGLL